MHHVVLQWIVRSLFGDGWIYIRILPTPLTQGSNGDPMPYSCNEARINAWCRAAKHRRTVGKSRRCQDPPWFGYALWFFELFEVGSRALSCMGCVSLNLTFIRRFAWKRFPNWQLIPSPIRGITLHGQLGILDVRFSRGLQSWHTARIKRQACHNEELCFVLDIAKRRPSCCNIIILCISVFLCLPGIMGTEAHQEKKLKKIHTNPARGVLMRTNRKRGEWHWYNNNVMHNSPEIMFCNPAITKIRETLNKRSVLKTRLQW